MNSMRGAGWRADCPQCVASKFTCDKHYSEADDTPASPTQLAGLAETLTEAQRRAIISTFQDECRHGPYHIFPNTPANRAAWRSLLPAGLVSREDEGFDLVIVRGRITGMVALTPLGLALRSHIQESNRS